MKHEMYDYDFGKFEKADDAVIDSSRLASKPANVDIFTEFEELDNLEITEEDIRFENTLIGNYQDLIDEAKAKKGLTKEDELEEIDEMETTKKIEMFPDEVLDKIDSVIEDNKEVAKEEIEVLDVKPMSLEAAFINCSILGFITLFFGYGMIFYIVSHL